MHHDKYIGTIKPAFYGGCSSVGRAPGCGPGGRGFEPHRSPHLYMPSHFLLLTLVVIATLLSIGLGVALAFLLFLRPKAKQTTPLTSIQQDPNLFAQLTQSVDQSLTPSLHMLHGRLDRIQTWLGELQTTSRGIDDVKQLLTHTKHRGTSGEISLQTILRDMLPAEQVHLQAKIIPGEDLIVDAAIRVMHQDGKAVWLPIDAKFPNITEQERSQRIRRLSSTLRQNAKSISQKYIRPPETMDFAILFLPSESLFMEALDIDGLPQQLFQEFHIYLAGPTTLSALITTVLLGIQAGTLSQSTHLITHLLKECQKELHTIESLLQNGQTRFQQLAGIFDTSIRKTAQLSQKLARGLGDSQR